MSAEKLAAQISSLWMKKLGCTRAYIQQRLKRDHLLHISGDEIWQKIVFLLRSPYLCAALIKFSVR